MTARRFVGISCASLAMAAALRFGAPRSQTFILKHLPVAEVWHEPEKKPRKVYRYSVIPGGAYSRDELALALKVDPIAAAHYSDFDASKASVHRLSTDTYVYVSYRKADHVYWTANKRRIPKGELVLTDGKHLARTRCGNRLSGIPEFPVARGPQPTEFALNAPELPAGIELPQAPPLGPDYETPVMPLSGTLARDFEFPVGTPGTSGIPDAFPRMSIASPYAAIGGLPFGIAPTTTEVSGGSGGNGAPPGPGSQIGGAVPEPASAGLLGMGGLLLMIQGIRFRRSRSC